MDPPEEADVASIRLKCYLGSTVSVVSVDRSIQYVELVSLLSTEFNEPVMGLRQ